MKEFKDKKIHCVIPAFNEEKKIRGVLKSLANLNFLDKIIVVDDSSNDNTKREAQGERVVYLQHIVNRGQGASLQTGNDYAIRDGADVIVHFDADGQFDSKEIKDVILPIINNEADIVFGSRFMGKKSNMPFFKEKVITPLAHLVNKVLIGQTLTDPQSGFRAMSLKVARDISIKNDRMAHCSEIIHESFNRNLRIKEVPITVTYHDFGQNLFGGFSIISDLFFSKLINK